jgi:hypothetical protein
VRAAAAQFSPCSAVSGEDLPDWLLFNPSASVGRSLTLGHPSVTSPASFVDVVNVIPAHRSDKFNIEKLNSSNQDTRNGVV